MPDDERTVEADICVVGAGPAGLTLALGLARRGRDVVVLDQKSAFERSFRGETMSPDAVWLLDRLGVLGRLRGSTLTTKRIELRDGGRRVLTADFAASGRPSPYPVEIPQPLLLAALHEQASALPGYRLLRGHAASGLLRDGAGRVAGVRCERPDGSVEVRAALTVAADGRYSTLRDLAGLDAAKIPLARDFVWFKVPMPPRWDRDVYHVRLLRGAQAVIIPTVPDHLRVGFNVPKGELRRLRARGIGALHERIAELAPDLAPTVRDHVADWSGTAALDIFTAVVPRWSVPGFVLAGDAAHTLSPVLGLGVHHALVDAVHLAPLAADALGRPGRGAALDAAAAEFQRLREPSVALSRSLQLRQERAFEVSGFAGAALRRNVYRAVDRVGFLKQRLMTATYYSLQQAAAAGALTIDVPDTASDIPVPDIPVPDIPVPDSVPDTSAATQPKAGAGA